MGLHDGIVFFLGPATFFNVGIQMVEPPLPTLLPDSARQVSGNVASLSSSELSDHHSDNFVLLLGPGAFCQIGIEHFLPPVQTLNISPVTKEARHLFSISRTEFFHDAVKFHILDKM